MVEAQKKIRAGAVKKRRLGAWRDHVEHVVRACESGEALQGYDPEQQKRKAEFHRRARAVCAEIARRLGCAKPDVHTNMGGPAVAGETILHTGSLVVEVSTFKLRRFNVDETERSWIWFRSAKGMTDHGSTSRTCWVAVELLRELPAVVEIMRAEPEVFDSFAPQSHFWVELPRCKDCGKTGSLDGGVEVTFAAEPCEPGLRGDMTNVWMCGECRAKRAGEP